MSQSIATQTDRPIQPACPAPAAPAAPWAGLFPAVPAALCLCLGIALFDVLPVWPRGYALLATAAAVAGAGAGLGLGRRRAATCTLALALGLMLLGLAVAQYNWFIVADDDIVHYSTAQPRMAHLRLQLDDAPRQTPMPGQRLPLQSVVARVQAVATTDGWRAASGRVQLMASQVEVEVEVEVGVEGEGLLRQGQRLEVTGELSRIAGPQNPGEYDFRAWQRKRGVYCDFNVDGNDAIVVLASPGPGLLGSARQMVRRALASGFAPDRQVELALTRALLLGDNDRALDELREDFRRSGTTHHLSIGGLHIGILAGFVYLICRLLAVAPKRAVWVGMAFAALYGLLVVPSPPVLRSVLLCLSVGLGLIVRRRSMLIQLLAVGMIVMLLVHPMDLFSPGFQLSFACVAGLMLLASPLRDFFLSLEGEHAQVARHVQPPRGLAHLRLRLRSALLNALAAGLIAWCVSMPLIAYHFHQLNPWAVPASIVLAPVVAATLVCGLIQVVLSLLIPPAAPLLSAPTAACAGLMRHMVHYLASLPGSEAATPSIPLALIVLYFVVLLLPLVPRWKKRRAIWCFPAGAALLVALVPPLVSAISRHLGQDVRLSCLSVGAASTGVVELPDGSAIMIDCGGGGGGVGTGAYQRIIDPFLRYRGITRIDTLYLTHGDSDHTNAAAELIASGRVGALAIHEGQSGIADVLEAARQAGVLVRRCRRGDHLQHGSVGIDVLWPPAPGEPLASNDASLVLRLESAGQSILFTGDIGERPRRELSASAPHADVLMAPHHGSATLWTAELLERLHPQAIVCSDGRTISAAQNRFAAMAAAVPLYHTRQSGAITVRLSPARPIAISTWAEETRAKPVP